MHEFVTRIRFPYFGWREPRPVCCVAKGSDEGRRKMAVSDLVVLSAVDAMILSANAEIAVRKVPCSK